MDLSEATGRRVVRNQNQRGNGRPASISTLLVHSDSPEQARGADEGRLTHTSALEPWNRSSRRAEVPRSTPALAIWQAVCAPKMIKSTTNAPIGSQGPEEESAGGFVQTR